MTVSRYVDLTIRPNTRNAKTEILALRENVDELSRQRSIPIDVDDVNGQKRIADLKLMLTDLGKKVETAKADVDTDEGRAKILDLELRLERFQRRTYSTKLNIRGADNIERDLLKAQSTIDAFMSRNSGNNGVFSRLSNWFRGNSNGSAAEGSEGASGLLPSALVGGGTLLAALAPSILGLATGLGIGGIGAYGAVSKNAGLQGLGSGILSSLLGTTSVLAGHPETSFKSPTESTSIVTSQATGLYAVFGNLQKVVAVLTPDLQKMFSASLPFINAFASVLGQSAKALIPAFTQTMQEMVKSGALREMTTGLVEITTDGLVPFLKVLGPGMKDSAVVFRATVLAIDGILVAFGAVSTVIGRELDNLGTSIGDVGKVFFDIGRIIAALLTGNWKAMGHAVDALGDNFRNFFATMADSVDAGFVKLSDFGHGVAHIFDDTRHYAAAAWSEMWRDVYGALKSGVSQDISYIKSYEDTLIRGFDNLRHSIAAIWDGLWGDAKSAARNGVSGIASAVHGIINAFESPIRFVVDDVWDRLANIWNSIQGVVHVGFRLPVVHMASGGVVPGSGDRDSVPALLTPGERILSRSQVSALGGHGALDALVGRGTGGPYAYAGGGIIGGIGSFFSGIGKDLLGWLTKPLSFIASHVFGAVENLLPEIGNTGLGSVLKTMMTDVIKSLSGSLHMSDATSGISGNVRSYTPDVLQALRLLGLPTSDLGTVLAQMTTESGGNPRAVNNSDSNAKLGTPSTGLMQVIAPTFARWAGPFRNVGPFMNGVSVDPLANIYAGLDYAVHRYGNPGWLNVLGHGHGYSNGGWITEPIIGQGLRSGMHYSLGENGHEYVNRAGTFGGPGGGDVYNIMVQGDTDPDGAALRIIQKVRDYKRHHGGQPTGIG